MKWNRLKFNRWCYEHQLVVILIVALLLLLLVALMASRCYAQPRMKIDSTFATETLSPLSLNSDTLIWIKTYQCDTTWWHEITEDYYVEVTPGEQLWPGDSTWRKRFWSEDIQDSLELALRLLADTTVWRREDSDTLKNKEGVRE